MKCSLLPLSVFVDGELSPERRAALDAHLVGCPRCTTGVATLRLEKERVGQLARVRLTPESADLMLEQVGITRSWHAPAERTPAPPAPPPPVDQRPWESHRGASPALPWTPSKRAPGAPWTPTQEHEPTAAIIPPAVPDPTPPTDQETVVPDAQPSNSWDGEGWSDDDLPVDGWEMDVPPAAEPGGGDRSWAGQLPAPAASVPATAAGWDRAAPPPTSQPSPPPPAYARAPTRVSASGPAALWSRVRDAVAVRLALARSGDAIDGSVQIVSGAAPPRGLRMPREADPIPAVDAIVAEPGGAPADAAAVTEDVELNGVAHSTAAAPVASSTASTPVAPTVGWPGSHRWDDDEQPPIDADEPSEQPETAGWNAFGAAAYARGDETDRFAPPPPVKAKPIGRHTRAVAREERSALLRIRRGVAATASAVRGRAPAAATGARQATVANANRRVVAAVVGLLVIFATALVVGRPGISSSPSSSTGSTASRLPAASAAPHASGVAAPGTSAAAPTAAPTPVPSAAKTYGDGGSGFQVRDLRYGQQPGYMRVVFDMGPVGVTVGQTPRVVVTSSGPKTLLVTFSGTVPAGSTGSPAPGTIIASVTLVTSSGGNTQYRIDLTRPVTTVGLYLTGTSPPLRFVLDLHG